MGATVIPGVETLNVAVMGCIVNGPGESKHADIGISLPGTGEQPAAPVFIDGKKAMTLRGANIADEFKVRSWLIISSGALAKIAMRTKTSVFTAADKARRFDLKLQHVRPEPLQ